MPDDTNQSARSGLHPLAFIPLAIYFLACLSGLVEFQLWPQVVHFRESDYSVYEMITHHHWFRYLLVYPIFQISNWTGLDYNDLFTVTVPGLIFSIAWFSMRSTQTMGVEPGELRKSLIFIGISSFFIFLSLYMNGRLLFGMTGSSILLWVMLYWDSNSDWKNLIAVVAVFILCSVSSGTFLIAVFVFYLFLAIRLYLRNSTICRRKIWLTYALLLVLINPYITMLVVRLFQYFDREGELVTGILSHGYGARLLSQNGYLLAFGCLGLIITVYLFRKVILRFWVISSLITISLAGGMFGISTAMIVLPPLLVVLSVAMLALIDRIDSGVLHE